MTVLPFRCLQRDRPFLKWVHTRILAQKFLSEAQCTNWPRYTGQVSEREDVTVSKNSLKVLWIFYDTRNWEQQLGSEGKREEEEVEISPTDGVENKVPLMQGKVEREDNGHTWTHLFTIASCVFRCFLSIHFFRVVTFTTLLSHFSQLPEELFLGQENRNGLAMGFHHWSWLGKIYLTSKSAAIQQCLSNDKQLRRAISYSVIILSEMLSFWNILCRIVITSEGTRQLFICFHKIDQWSGIVGLVLNATVLVQLWNKNIRSGWSTYRIGMTITAIHGATLSLLSAFSCLVCFFIHTAQYFKFSDSHLPIW